MCAYLPENIGNSHYQGVRRGMVLVVKFFGSLKLFFCFVVAMSDLVHDVEATDGLC